MEALLCGLWATAARDRRAIPALCAHADLAAAEMAMVLDHSRCQVARPLQHLIEAGVLQSREDGSRTTDRVKPATADAAWVESAVDPVAHDDPLHAHDLLRRQALAATRQEPPLRLE